MSFEQFQANPSTNPSPRGFEKSPLGRFKLISKKGVVFSFEAVLETSPVEVRGEGTSSETVQAGFKVASRGKSGISERS